MYAAEQTWHARSPMVNERGRDGDPRYLIVTMIG
jgi:hypothetical protein